MLNAVISAIDQMGTVAGCHALRESLLHVLLLRIGLQRSLTVSSWDASIDYQGLRLIYLRKLRVLNRNMFVKDLTIKSKVTVRTFYHRTVRLSSTVIS
jgi:hypothetical protein